jgi:hypothetical protein
MNNQIFLIKIVVVLALLGYLASSIYMFHFALTLDVEKGVSAAQFLKDSNPAIMYITSGLTGLVGGIVATAFGVKETNNTPPNAAPANQKLRRLSSYVFTPTPVDDAGVNNNNGLYGTLYSLAYIVVGTASAVIWIILGKDTIPSVAFMATTFFGMLIPIVAAYFNPN